MRARCVAGDVGVEPAARRTRTDGCQGARGSGSPVNTAVTTGSDGLHAAVGWGGGFKAPP